MKGNKLIERSSLTATVNNLPSIGVLDPSIFVGSILLKSMLIYLINAFKREISFYMMIYIWSANCISVTYLTTLVIYLSLMMAHLLDGFRLPHLQMQIVKR